MTLAELIAEVHILTGRPDLVDEATAAVRKATLKLHSTDYYYKDLVEKIIGFTTEGYKQQYDLSINVPEARTMKYVRHWTPTHVGSEKYLDKIEPDAIMDSYGKEFTNCWYVAGTLLNIKSKELITNLVIGYYKRPNITTNLYSSWIAVEEPYYIIEEAALYVCTNIGRNDLAAILQRQSAANIAMLKQNYLDAQAR